VAERRVRGQEGAAREEVKVDGASEYLGTRMMEEHAAMIGVP
jgi:hypothetical protein